MKYFVTEAIFNDPLPVNEEKLKVIMDEHEDVIRKGFESGWILLSGPKAHTRGGFVIARGSSVEELEKVFSADPFTLTGVASFRITEFKLFDCQPMLKEWFSQK